MKFTRVFAFMALAGLAGSAFATNGYFSHGYGMKAKGMAGVLPPCRMMLLAAQTTLQQWPSLAIDLIWVPIYSARVVKPPTPTTMVLVRVTFDSDSNYFLVPEFGYNHMMSDTLALGVTVYGNGGMNTTDAALGGMFGTKNLLGGDGSWVLI